MTFLQQIVVAIPQLREAPHAAAMALFKNRSLFFQRTLPAYAESHDREVVIERRAALRRGFAPRKVKILHP